MIDHIIYADPDLERGVAAFASDYGVEPVPGGRHAGFGTRNALLGLGDAYLEIMGIDCEQAVPAAKRFFGLHAQAAPRYAAWCARANRPLAETVRIARKQGLDLGEILSMSREQPDGTTLAWTLTSPFAQRDTVLPFYIDWGGAANPASSLPPQLRLASLTLVHPDATRIHAILRALGEDQVSVELGPEPSLRVGLEKDAR